LLKPSAVTAFYLASINRMNILLTSFNRAWQIVNINTET